MGPCMRPLLSTASMALMRRMLHLLHRPPPHILLDIHTLDHTEGHMGALRTARLLIYAGSWTKPSTT